LLPAKAECFSSVIYPRVPFDLAGTLSLLILMAACKHPPLPIATRMVPI
jgi:hypothetical protein